jgi:hypothetical protein
MWRQRFRSLLEIFAFVAVLLAYGYVHALPDFLAWLALLVFVGMGIHAYIKHDERVQVAQSLRRRCKRCGYDTRANVDRCSECGEPIPPR